MAYHTKQIRRQCTFVSFRAEIKCTLHVALPKRPIYQFNLVQQNRKQTLRAYCSNIYNVSKGPDAELRHIRLSFRQYETYEEYHEAKNFLYQDFDNETGEITINPFKFVHSPDLPFIAKATDKFILENMSTSPKVEPKHFCSEIRDAVRLILKNPDSSQSIFAQNQPRKYLFSDNERKWMRIKP